MAESSETLSPTLKDAYVVPIILGSMFDLNLTTSRLPNNAELPGSQHCQMDGHEPLADVSQHERNDPADVQAEQTEESSPAPPQGILRAGNLHYNGSRNLASKKRQLPPLLRSINDCLPARFSF